MPKQRMPLLHYMVTVDRHGVIANVLVCLTCYEANDHRIGDTVPVFVDTEEGRLAARWHWAGTHQHGSVS